MNSTAHFTISMKDYYIVCSISLAFSLIAILLGLFVLIMVWKRKPRLHTCRHLLMCNSSAALIFYCVVQNNNYLFLIFLPWQTSDISCRWRGYFTYMSIVAVSYSYLIQAISRLLFVIFSTNYPSLITFKAHYVLIILHWLVVILIPLPAIVTEDIHFIPDSICWVPFKAMFHVICTVVVHYCVPLGSVVIMYAYIYYRVKKVKRNVVTVIRRTNNENRDLELLRNILILVVIFLVCGAPTVVFIVTSIKIFYLISIVTLSFCAASVQMCTILLDRDLRQILRDMFTPTTHITILQNTSEHKKI
jgi:hypothetical protein